MSTTLALAELRVGDRLLLGQRVVRISSLGPPGSPVAKYVVYLDDDTELHGRGDTPVPIATEEDRNDDTA